MKAYTKESYFTGGFQVTERIYTLSHPTTKEIFYIGKTKKPLSDRLWGHIAAARKKGDKFRNCIKDEHILALIASGDKPKIETIESITPISYIEYLEIAEREIYWMKQFHEKGHPIMNIMGLKITQPNAKYLWYLETKSKGSVSADYYYCGKDITGVSLFHKERILADGLKWEDDPLPEPIKKRYNPYNNPFWMKKMGITV